MPIPTAPLANPIDMPRPEAAFRIEGSTELCPRFGDQAMQIYLARRVAARPKDLRCHTRRVLLSHSLGDAEEAFAALVDLSIATGAKGEALKRRLVRICAPLLTPAQRRLLEEDGIAGLPAATSAAPARSMLTSGASGGKVLVGHS
jgi:hypothetical protein